MIKLNLFVFNLKLKFYANNTHSQTFKHIKTMNVRIEQASQTLIRQDIFSRALKNAHMNCDTHSGDGKLRLQNKPFRKNEM